MIVVRADESVDGNDAVAAGPVLDDDWLSPALRKPVRQQPRAEIRAASRSEREDQFHRAVRPGVRANAMAVAATNARMPMTAASRRLGFRRIVSSVRKQHN